MINNKKLKKARNKIDKIDRGIFNHIKKRTHVIKYMLSLKMYKKQIVDHRRINEILKNFKKKINKKWSRSQNNLPDMEIDDLELYRISKKKF